MRTHRTVRSAFTLIEILIVVVILGILAAIVIPQFTDASQEASESSVKSTMQTVRSQIELYRVKHGGVLPADLDALVDEEYLQAIPTAPEGYAFEYAAGELTVTCPDGIDCADW
jgi:prepilin-type N-terminal cleavage/methylation domain-containing protein